MIFQFLKEVIIKTKLICLLSVTLLLIVTSNVRSEPFSLIPTFDTHVSNDENEGPDTSPSGTGMHIRDIPERRRVAFVTYDLTEVKSKGAIFSNVSFSNYGHDQDDPVDVYGVLEAQEDLVGEGMTWNTAPGVQNDPTPALGAPVALDLADITDILLTFTPPAQGVRESTETSEALADFLNSDTNGFVAFMFAPAEEGGQAIVRTVEMGEDGGTRLEGDMGGFPKLAHDPNPEDETQDVPRDVVLSWTQGGYAATHDVYFGKGFEDVNDASRDNDPQGVLVSQDQLDTTYDPEGLLEFGQTYYWRIDEVNAAPDNTIYKGDVWSFMVEPFVYPIDNIIATASSSQNADMGPEKTVDGSGLNENDQHSTADVDMWLSSAAGPQPSWIKYEFDSVYKLHEMWVWNSNMAIEPVVGLGVKDVTIECSTDDINWTQLTEVDEFNQATGLDNYTHNTTVSFSGAVAKYVKITVNSNFGGLGQCGLSEVRFFYKPVRARVPKPADGQEGLGLSVVLSWIAGREAALHEIYFSDDRQAVVDGTAFLDSVSQNSYTLTSLEFGETYYWKIVEVNEAESPTRFESDVWSFSTLEYSVVDDFEDYNDSEPERVFNTWVDGWGVDENGSQVGYSTAPFAEQTIVNSGTQSMPFSYNNTGSATYSEAIRTFDAPQDWTIGGVNTLRLYLRGYPTAFLESSAGNIVMSGAGTDIFGTADEFRFAYKNLGGDGSIAARVESLVDTDTWAKAGVMIREALDPGSKWAAVFLTGDNGVRFQARPLSNDESTSDTDVATSEQTALREPVWIKIERSGNEFNGFYATDEAGTAWTPMVWNPQTINMTSNVCIGLAVTSHSAGNSTIAEFSGVSTTGSVTGQWQVEAVGVEMAENDPDYLYVIVEGGGKAKTYEHPDNPNAVLEADWQPWDIPLNVFSDAGVTLSAVKKMSIGVGSKTAPQQSGEGRVYFDDIRLYSQTEPDPNTQ
jgi:hypothetical protein